MDGAVVEFNALADADRAGAEDDDGIAALRFDFVFLSVGGIVVRRMGFKFRGACIDHLVVRMDIEFLLQASDRLFIFRNEMGNGAVRHLDALRIAERVFIEAFLAEPFFRHDDVLHLVQEEQVDLRDAVDFFRFDAAPQRFRDDEEAFIVHAVQEAADIIQGRVVQLGQMDIALAHFQAAHGLDKGAFKGAVDGHDFAGGLHLRADLTVGEREFFEGPAREFQHHIVNGRFEAGLRIAGDGIGDLIEVHAQCDLRCHLGDRIARGLGGQRGGAAYTGIDFDDVIVIGAGPVRTVRCIRLRFSDSG